MLKSARLDWFIVQSVRSMTTCQSLKEALKSLATLECGNACRINSAMTFAWYALTFSKSHMVGKYPPGEDEQVYPVRIKTSIFSGYQF